MPRGFYELDLTEVQAVLWDNQFRDTDMRDCMEHTFERRYGYTDFGIIVFSSLDKRSNECRDVGSDAIRVVVWDYIKNKPVIEHRVYRTQHAVTNMLDKCKETWTYIAKNRCQLDGGLMIERSGKYGKFMGCSNYPTCKNIVRIKG